MNATIRRQIVEQKLKVVKCPPTKVKDAAFLPLLLSVLMPHETVTFDLFVKVRQPNGGSVTFLPYYKRGETIRPDWLASLSKLGVDRLYIEKNSLDQVLAYLNNNLMIHDFEGADSPRKLTILREHLHLSLHRAFSAPYLGPHIQLASKTLDKFLASLATNPDSFSLIGQILYYEYSLYTHSVNVSLLGLAVMIFMRKTRKESLLLGLAGLFHDLGMTRIPEDIIYKIEALQETEREILNKHPCYGYQMLKASSAFPLEALRLVLEHHENADGSGYPQGLTLSQQHPLTRVLRVLDSYDALTCQRPYRPALKPFAALTLMQEERGDKGPIFDAAVLKNLIRFLALTG